MGSKMVKMSNFSKFRNVLFTHVGYIEFVIRG